MAGAYKTMFKNQIVMAARNRMYRETHQSDVTPMSTSKKGTSAVMATCNRKVSMVHLWTVLSKSLYNRGQTPT
jgi:hypothetical protein